MLLDCIHVPNNRPSLPKNCDVEDLRNEITYATNDSFYVHVYQTTSSRIVQFVFHVIKNVRSTYAPVCTYKSEYAQPLAADMVQGPHVAGTVTTESLDVHKKCART